MASHAVKVVHLRYDNGKRVYCGRLAARLDHVHSGDPAAIPELLGKDARVCAICRRSRERSLRDR